MSSGDRSVPEQLRDLLVVERRGGGAPAVHERADLQPAGADAGLELRPAVAAVAEVGDDLLEIRHLPHVERGLRGMVLLHRREPGSRPKLVLVPRLEEASAPRRTHRARALDRGHGDELGHDGGRVRGDRRLRPRQQLGDLVARERIGAEAAHRPARSDRRERAPRPAATALRPPSRGAPRPNRSPRPERRLGLCRLCQRIRHDPSPITASAYSPTPSTPSRSFSSRSAKAVYRRGSSPRAAASASRLASIVPASHQTCR